MRCFKVTCSVELRSVSWGDEHVIYSCASGDTFLIDTLALCILEYLKSEKTSVPIGQIMSQLIDPGPGNGQITQAREGVEQRLERLKDFNLIEEA